MSDPAPAPEVPPFSFPRTAYALAFILVAGFVVITVDGFRQKGLRAELEQTSQTTAVGDQAWYQPPAAPIVTGPSPTAPGEAPYPGAVVYHGESLFLVGSRRYELRETKLTAVGKDDSGKYAIYASRETIPPLDGEAEHKGAPVYFLKTGLGEFVKVQRGAPETK